MNHCAYCSVGLSFGEGTHAPMLSICDNCYYEGFEMVSAPPLNLDRILHELDMIDERLR